MTVPISLQAILEPSLRYGLIDPGTADRIRRDVQENRTDPVRAVSLLGRIPASSIYQAVASDRGIDFVDRAQLVLRRDLLSRVPEALVRRKRVLPLREEGPSVLVAVGDMETVGDDRLKETLRHIFDKPVRFALADPEELLRFIEEALDDPARREAGAPPSSEDAVGFVESMMREAFVRRASDIHLEPGPDGYRIRFRVDGELQVFHATLPPALSLAALSRLKVLARMDIAESREPQDGSLVYALEGADSRAFDIRIATAPTKYGERATLRLLGTEAKSLTLGDLGFLPAMYARFRDLILRPSGLILLTGPTGSGKTTTLYAALQELNLPDLNVMTVEDPIEYTIPGVSQMEIDAVGKVTFSSALRSLLRHDPDVLMVGEIRDKDTADMALRAAMTGHLVFSTLHTSTAVGAVTRLVDMGCEPYLVAATLVAVVSQRLVRRLCPACAVPRPRTPEDDAVLGTGDGAGEVREPRGCLRCQRTGFLGRIAVFEMLQVDEAAREAVASGAGERRIAQAAGHLTTLMEDAAFKVASGLTSIDEVRRIAILGD